MSHSILKRRNPLYDYGKCSNWLVNQQLTWLPVPVRRYTCLESLTRIRASALSQMRAHVHCLFAEKVGAYKKMFLQICHTWNNYKTFHFVSKNLESFQIDFPSKINHTLRKYTVYTAYFWEKVPFDFSLNILCNCYIFKFFFTPPQVLSLHTLSFSGQYCRGRGNG